MKFSITSMTILLLMTYIYVFLPELIALLNKSKQYYKPALKAKFEMIRKRPRRPGKPL